MKMTTFLELSDFLVQKLQTSEFFPKENQKLEIFYSPVKYIKFSPEGKSNIVKVFYLDGDSKEYPLDYQITVSLIRKEILI